MFFAIVLTSSILWRKRFLHWWMGECSCECKIVFGETCWLQHQCNKMGL